VTVRTPYPTAEEVAKDLGITPREKKRLDRLLADMQMPHAKRAAKAAFDASPAELGGATVSKARKRGSTKVQAERPLRDRQIDSVVEAVHALNLAVTTDRYFWSFSLNHSPQTVLDSGHYFILWRRQGRGDARFVFHGPCSKFLEHVHGLTKTANPAVDGEAVDGEITPKRTRKSFKWAYNPKTDGVEHLYVKLGDSGWRRACDNGGSGDGLDYLSTHEQCERCVAIDKQRWSTGK